MLQYPEVEQIVDQVENRNCPLSNACLGGSIEVVKLLLQYPNVVQNITLVNSGGTALFKACSKGHIEIAKLLLTYPEGRQSFFSEPALPLYTARSEGHIEIVKLLLEYLKNYQSSDTQSFDIQVAMMASKEQPDILTLLTTYQQNAK